MARKNRNRATTATLENGSTVTVDNMSRVDGIAGNYAYGCRVTYRHPADTADARASEHWVSFSGSSFGAPVVMVTEHGQTFVTDWRRFGDELTADWVRRFFGGRP